MDSGKALYFMLRYSGCYIALIALLLTGCTTAPKANRASSPRRASEASPAPEFWFPTRSERKRAEQIAREYATRTLGLSQAQVGKMRTGVIAFDKGDAHELLIQFYDPTVFQPLPNGRFVSVRGGFPGYFSITVNALSWRVIHHYASRT